MPIVNVGSYGNEAVCDNCHQTYNIQSTCGCDADLLILDMTLKCDESECWIFQDDTDPESRCICPECIQNTKLPFDEVKEMWEENGEILNERE